MFDPKKADSAMARLPSELEVDCPCCRATLVVDLGLKRVVSYQESEREDKPKIEEAHDILAAEKARRETIFSQSVADEKGRGDALSKRFEEALKQAHTEPVEKPLRDFDLD